MINWFMEQTISLSVVCLVLLLLHRLLLSKFGAHYTYFMWISVPLLMIADLLQMILPHHFSWFGSNNAASIIQQYYVFASAIPLRCRQAYLIGYTCLISTVRLSRY
ncbi:hypothetical protein ABIS04_17175 [Shewanella sp. H8]|uniref:hypothetical protein n=1 Tax=Shewanella sp. H8 TaxID=3342676 RepID=UPI0033153F5B